MFLDMLFLCRSTKNPAGIMTGFPVTDLKVTLIDGDSHDVDSSVMAFEIASRAAFREVAQKAKPQLLEPMMRIEVVTLESTSWESPSISVTFKSVAGKPAS